jgi:hypothetical protein
LLDDVVAETQAVLMGEVANGREIEDLCAYAGQVARSVVRLLRQQEAGSGVDVNSVACSPGLASFDQLVARRGLSLKFLRGATQQKLVAAVRAGVGVEAIAEALGMEVGEVRRQVERLAARIWKRRENLAKLRRESPDADST